MVPYEAFLSEKPVPTTTDAGGPLEVVTDGRTGYVTSPDPAELARAAGRLREHPDERGAWARGQRLAARVTWDRCIETLSKIAYYSPLPAERSGIADYSATCSPRSRSGSTSSSRAAPPRAEGGHRALPRRQQPGRARLDRRRSAQATRRRRPPRLRPPSPRRRADDRPRRRARLPRRDGARGGVVGRLLAHGVLDKRIPPLWRAGRRTTTSPARCSTSRPV